MSYDKITLLILVIEFSVVLLIVDFIYIAYGYVNWKKRNMKKKMLLLTRYLKNEFSNLSDSKSAFKNFPKSLCDLNVILKVIKQLDDFYNINVLWNNFREQFILAVALPLARKKAFEYKYSSKLIAIQVFGLLPLNEDEETMMMLLSNSNNLIQLNALKALLAIFSKRAVNFIIFKLSNERNLNKSIYLSLFNDSSIKIANIVFNELNKINDSSLREICYQILLKCNIEKTEKFPSDKDIFSDNCDLRVASTKFLSLCEPEKAIPILLALLEDSYWQVKVAALHALTNFLDYDITKKIENCLRDENWWVRYTAAKTLKKMGNVGVTILNNQKKNEDLFAYEVSRFVLNKKSI